MSTDWHPLFQTRPWRRPMAALDGAPWGFLGRREGHLLYALARDYASGEGVLVDAGAFLGCSAWYFAQGLARNAALVSGPRPLIHCFDNFIVNEPVTTDAVERQFGERLVEGASTRHLFDRQTRDIAPWLHVHHGDFHTYAWTPAPIEILLVDIAKAPSLNRRVIEVFFPHLVPARSVVVHQDYHHPWLPHIHVAMEVLHDYFALVEAKVDDSAVFLLTAPVPPEALAAAARAHELPFDEQLALMDRALTRLPADATRHVELARAKLLADGRGYEALRDALGAIDARYPESDPGDPLWASNRRGIHDLAARLRLDLVRAWRLLQEGKHEEALAIADAIPESDPRAGDARVLRAQYLRQAGQREAAAEVLVQALRAHPRHASLLIEQAWLMFEHARLGPAVEAAEAALACAATPDQRRFAQNVLELALSGLGRHDDAIRAGEAAVSGTPAHPWIMLHHAQTLARAGRHDEARAMARRVLDLQPANADAQAIAGRPG